jgi:hypothetical protein
MVPRLTSFEFRVSSFELRFPIPDSRFPSFEFRVSIHDFRFPIPCSTLPSYHPTNILSHDLQEFSHLLHILLTHPLRLHARLLDSTEDLFVHGLSESRSDCGELLDDLTDSLFILDHLDDPTELSFDTAETVRDTLFLVEIFDTHGIIGYGYRESILPPSIQVFFTLQVFYVRYYLKQRKISIS